MKFIDCILDALIIVLAFAITGAAAICLNIMIQLSTGLSTVSSWFVLAALVLAVACGLYILRRREKRRLDDFRHEWLGDKHDKGTL